MMAYYAINSALFLVLIAVSFFFSLAETSIIALSKLRVRHLVSQGIKGADSLERLVLKLDKVVTAILICNNFTNIAISVILTAFIIMHIGYKWGSLISTLISVTFILVFCEITPKIIATKHAEKLALFSGPIMEKVIVMIHPVITFFSNSAHFMMKLFKIDPAKRSPLISEEELRLMIEVGKEEGILSDEERKMLHRIFEFGDTRLSEVMVPKEKIIGVEVNTNSEELLNIFVEQGHARLPVYSGSIDNIIGIIFARDLLYILRDKGLFVLQDLVHDVRYVSPTLRVNELLRKFQAEKIQMAIVVNQNNKTLGIVTLEDLIEEIVGEIEEEQSRFS